MHSVDTDRIKQREIHFRDLHPERNDAQTAADFLASVGGVVSAEPRSPIILSLSYDLFQTSLEEIEGALTELGLHLDNGLVYRLKRALHYYTEETYRENNGLRRGDSNCTKRVFARRWETLEHGCRDQRPEHWRRYL
ncbi:MAG: hypothetical protein EA400_07720 [Chromatiaceae bacterium]|nr:MAG: hypothetical protein EA400_07720 [Chromatiaceae bacterium]